jgi:non-heme chloroperoxidase
MKIVSALGLVGTVAIAHVRRHQGHGASKLAFFAATAPSVIRYLDFPYGLLKEGVTKTIQEISLSKRIMISSFYTSSP